MNHFISSWLQPDWPAPFCVKAVMTDRHGGVSQAPWDSMNLGEHVGDVAAHTQTNRQRLQMALGTRPVFLQQVHGVQAVALTVCSQDRLQADACIATGAGVACTIMVADCLPVLLCDAHGRWVAGAHAGWRGLAGHEGMGVLENLLRTPALQQTSVQDILVWLGPCIGPAAFEVGQDVRAVFCTPDPGCEPFFRHAAPGKWLADLAGLARHRLQRQGLHRVYGNDSTPPWCTVTQESSFFSHRRDSRRLGQTGRMAACIWISD